MRQAAILVCVLVVGCGGGSLPAPPLTRHAREAFREVPFPPPPARVEVVPPSPGSAAVWIDGEWVFRGRRWGWTYGRWLVVPSGLLFAPSAFRRLPDGTLLHAPGTFRTPDGREVAEPASLAVGRAREGDVVSPQGRPERTAPNDLPPPEP